MISVLIPVYNFDVTNLVIAITNQAKANDVAIEVICYDDVSENNIRLKNQHSVNFIDRCSYFVNSKNLGRTKTRQLLAEKATYDWLLFLDADVFPKDNNFISKYAIADNGEYNAFFGGIAYDEKTLNKNNTLRYNFGKHRESVNAANRNNLPYKVTTSGNMLIKKDVFLETNSKLSCINCYGLDYYFGALLKENKVKIKHIDNEVYHLGIENNAVYLKKVQESIKTLATLVKTKKLPENDISLLKAYDKLKRYGLQNIFGKITKRFSYNIENKLINSGTNLRLLDIYKLGRFCNEMNRK